MSGSSASIEESSPDRMEIGPPSLNRRGDWIRVSFPVTGASAPELWFDVDADHAHLIGQTSEPAIAALLVPAMAAGKPLSVLGQVSEMFLWNIRNIVIPVVQRQLPFLQSTTVIAEEIVDEGDRTEGEVLTALSCGVDSLSALKDHLLTEDLHPDSRASLLLFSHVGHHGYGSDLEQRVDHRWIRIKSAAEELGLPIVRVYSNAPDFYPPEHDSRLNWAATLTIRNAAVPLLLQRGVRQFLFASSHEWHWIRVRPTKDMTEADPILLPALSTEKILLSPVGSVHTRVEKTKRIADLELARKYLDVCIMEGSRNCSKCEKCLRTILTLEVLGRLDDFSQRFDLNVYRQHRGWFLARVLAEREKPFHLELQSLMAEERFTPPVKARARALLLRVWRLIPKSTRLEIKGRLGRA